MTWTIQDCIRILSRGKWWLVASFIVGTAIAIAYSYSLPPIYRSSTLIMVEPQKVPTAYVSPTVTSTVQERLTTISQQILSRTNLERIITQFDLYKNGGEEASGLLNRLARQIERWAGLDLQKIRTQLNLSQAEESTPMPKEEIVEGMRKGIGVKVVGAGNAFTISYIGKDPLTVMKVTNTLASLFIEENLKLREQQAEGTSDFLESQLAEAKRQLEKQETALTGFKEKQMGALPGQMDANLRTLDRLQLELQTINDGLRSGADRKITLQKLKSEMQGIDEALRNVGEENTTTPMGAHSGRQAPQLMRLKEELARLQAEFNDRYPDVIRLKKQISEAEGSVSTAEMPPPTGGVSSRPGAQSAIDGAQQQTLYSAELLTLNNEIESLKRRRERAITQIKQYEKRVEDTFINEQNLLNLTRDYEMSQRNYQGLLDKRINAKISENLEKRQKGEQFRVLDPANLPQKPYEPDRLKIILLGSLLSGAFGAGLILLREYLGPSYRRAEDFRGTVDLPVLVTIPRTKITQKENPPLITLQEPDSLITEQYRVLYTRLSQLDQGKQTRVLAVSSAIKGEGKTITTLNLALVSARDFGKKTLLIEGDLKNPAVSSYIRDKSANGLVEILTNTSGMDQISMVNFGHDNLSVLPVAKGIRNSSGILSSQRMSNLISMCKERFDMILIDSPPVLSFPDINIIEGMVDGIIFVVRAERTRRDAVMMAIESLGREKIIGIILNDVKIPLSRYYGYYYYTKT